MQGASIDRSMRWVSPGGTEGKGRAHGSAISCTGATGLRSPTFCHRRMSAAGDALLVRLRLGVPGILPRAGGRHCRAVQVLLLCRAMPPFLATCPR